MPLRPRRRQSMDRGPARGCTTSRGSIFMSTSLIRGADCSGNWSGEDPLRRTMWHTVRLLLMSQLLMSQRMVSRSGTC